MKMSRNTAERSDPELRPGGNPSHQDWRRLASKCKVQLDAAVWKLQRPHTQNIHDSWAPPDEFRHHTASHSRQDCDDHSRQNKGQTYSVWTNSRGWKKLSHSLARLAVSGCRHQYILLQNDWTQNVALTGLVFIHKLIFPHSKGEIKIAHS